VFQDVVVLVCETPLPRGFQPKFTRVYCRIWSANTFTALKSLSQGSGWPASCAGPDKKSARTHCWRTPLSKYVLVLGLLKIKMKIWSSAPAHFAPGPQPLASGRRLCASAQAFGLALELYRVSRRICIRDVRNWPGFQAVCEFSPIGPQPRNPAPLKATVW